MSDVRKTPARPILLIPARMGSTRLPNKPMADIRGAPMIVHVWRRAMESKIGPVAVACDSEIIADAVQKAGGEAVLTDPLHPRGSDRIWEALQILEKRHASAYDAVINVQGDVPSIEPAAIRAAYDLLRDPKVDIATLAVVMEDEADQRAPQIVKVVLDARAGDIRARALYFSRLPVPSGEGPMYHHVGIYAYRREALAKFAAAPETPLEKRESLEQLRALSLDLRIEATIIETVPLGVDTPADLEKARKMMAGK